jgi:uncharacterized membrane protein (UPF0127 family)
MPHANKLSARASAIRVIALLALLALVWGLNIYFRQFQQVTPKEPRFGLGTLDIQTQTGLQHFDVDIATSRQQHAHGLMFRKSLPERHGMLFVFPEADTLDFWMKNTYIPLDIIFVSDDMRILRIEANAQPLSEHHIASGAPVRFVIELAGGSAATYDIHPGDRIRYSVYQ